MHYCECRYCFTIFRFCLVCSGQGVKKKQVVGAPEQTFHERSCDMHACDILVYSAVPYTLAALLMALVSASTSSA